MEKKSNKALSVLLVIIIPLLFAASLSVIIFSLMGVNVIDKAKSYASDVPVISQWVDEEEGMKPMESNDEMVNTLKQQISHLKEKVKEAESDVLKKDDEIKQQQSDIAQLKDQLQSKEEENEQKNDSVDKVAEVYGTMPPGNAAKIFESMKQGEAIMILTNLDTDAQAAILAEMDPGTAAELTKSMTN